MSQQFESGKVFWVTGLSGAGKTTLARKLFDYLSTSQQKPVLLDGDNLREVLGGGKGYLVEDRLQLAKIYSRLCQMLYAQRQVVICATVSMFHEVREENRRKIGNYTEIYLKPSMEDLIARDQKGLYSGVASGKVEQVMGMDVEFEEPRAADIVITNTNNTSPEQTFQTLLNKLGV